MNEQELFVRYSISKLENYGIRIPSDPTIELLDVAIIFLKFLFLSGDYLLPHDYTNNLLYDLASKVIITMPLLSCMSSFNIKGSFLQAPLPPDMIEEP